MDGKEPLLPKHGGYRRLKSFQVAQLAYDVTVRFCGRYIDPRSRTHDQMVQAARSGVQNIAEGSQASGTSKKMELKLTNVARASLEELRLDYEDFLRQRGMPLLPPEHPALHRFRQRRCATLREVQQWVAEERERGVDEHGHSRTDTDQTDGKQAVAAAASSRPPSEPPAPSHLAAPTGSSVPVRVRPCSSVPPLSSSCLAANAVLSLLNLACHLLDRQITALATTFENEGGFTERLYRVRSARRGTR